MHPIENIIETSLERIKNLVDVSTVVGAPVTAPEGTMLLPVSKITLGFMSGGGEYGERSAKKGAYELSDGAKYPFTGAATVGMSLKPTAFLSVEQGNVRVIPAAPNGAVDKLADLVPQVLKSIEKLAYAMVDNAAEKCENNKNSEDKCGRSDTVADSKAVRYEH